jgi:hypothetical protein
MKYDWDHFHPKQHYLSTLKPSSKFALPYFGFLTLSLLLVVLTCEYFICKIKQNIISLININTLAIITYL